MTDASSQSFDENAATPAAAALSPAPGVFALDADVPDDDAMTNDGAVSTGETHADNLD